MFIYNVNNVIYNNNNNNNNNNQKSVQVIWSKNKICKLFNINKIRRCTNEWKWQNYVI